MMIYDLLKITIPAIIVLYAMYLTMKSLLNKEMEKKLIDLKAKSSELVIPIRLQAYERVCLFLERISPNNLLTRLSMPTLSAKELQSILLKEIREEYNHNLSQQVYMSDGSWKLAKNTMEEIVMLINQSSDQCAADAKSVDLAKRIMENMLSKDVDLTEHAISYVKNEIREMF